MTFKPGDLVVCKIPGRPVYPLHGHLGIIVERTYQSPNEQYSAYRVYWFQIEKALIMQGNQLINAKEDKSSGSMWEKRG